MAEVGEFLLTFSVGILAVMNFAINYISRKYIQSKPFGALTAYDLVHCDVIGLVSCVIFTVCLAIGWSLIFRYLQPISLDYSGK